MFSLSRLFNKREFASQYTPMQETLFKCLEPRKKKELPKELKERSEMAFKIYNKKHQDKIYKRNADVANKIFFMQRAIDALPTNRMRQLAMAHDDTLFPKERHILLENPPAFKEYPDETGEGYYFTNSLNEIIDPKTLGVDPFEVIENKNRLERLKGNKVI